MKNLFSYSVENEFNSTLETIVNINYCGRPIGIAFMYLDSIYIDFTESQPMIPMDEWHFITPILKKIKERNLFTPSK